jgi:hypothetical protein
VVLEDGREARAGDLGVAEPAADRERLELEPARGRVIFFVATAARA